MALFGTAWLGSHHADLDSVGNGHADVVDFSNAQITHLPIGVWDQDNSAPSRQLVRYLNATPGIQVVQYYDNASSAEQAMDAVDVYAVVVIPQDFAAKMKTGRAAPIALQVNAQFGTHSGQIQNSVQRVVGTFSAGVEIQARNKRGQNLQQAKDTFTPIRTATVTLFNLSSNYQQTLASTMIPALLHILAMTAGAYAIGREIRDHHLGNWIRHACEYAHPDASPRFWDVVFALNGKLLWPMLSFTVWAAITIALSTRSHQASMLSWLATFVAIWLMMLVSLWMGVIVTTLSMSLRMGLSMTGFITAPAFAFAGVGFPTFAMPIGARIWANLVPLTHYLKLQINQLQMNAPFWWAIPSLLGFTTAVVILLLLSSALTLRVLKQPERWGAR